MRTGRTVADSLTAAGIMTPLAVKMLRVGEESGRMQPVAAHLAADVRGPGGGRLQRLVAIIEPVTVIVLGLVVGGIVMSILTAVLSVNELALVIAPRRWRQRPALLTPGSDRHLDTRCLLI